jgi:filamentous hemagglutinin family protein
MSRQALQLSCLIMLVTTGLPLRAQIKTDGSMGARQTLSGPAFAIPANLGKQAGGNLFHSFSDFNIQTGQSATFSGPTSIQNVLARVTGGSASTIDGALRCDIAGANLYFMNPAGVVFGANATLDVSGSFAVTSADSIRLGKSARFNAAPVSGEVLSSASPTAFGFLAKQNSDITASGSQLSVATGKTLSVIANGNIRLSSAAVLDAPAGRINLVAGASSGQVGLRADAIDSPIDSSLAAYGDVSFASGAGITASGDFGGPIAVRAHDFSMKNSGLLSITTGATPGRLVDLQLAGELSMNASAIGVSTNGGAASGDLDIRAHRIALAGGSLIFSDSAGDFRGAHMSLRAHRISLDGMGTLVVADPIAGSTGPGGDISLRADRLSITGGAGAVVAAFGSGRGGNLTVRTGDLFIRGIGENDSDTGLIAGSGLGAPATGGDITVTAKTIRMENGANIGGNTTGAGAGSNVRLTADSLTLRDSGTAIQARSIAATGGPGGEIRLDIGSVAMTRSAVITAATEGTGNAGNVLFNVDSLSLRSSAIVTAGTEGEGAGGNIDVAARRSVLLRGDTTGLLVATQPISNGGDAGRISVTAPSVVVRNNAFIVSGTSGSGNGGSVSVTANDLTVSAGGVIGNAALPGSTGNSGSVAVRAASLTVTDGGIISATALGSGNGGAVDVRADHVLLQGSATAANTGVFAATADNTPGAAGDITFRRTGDVRLVNGGSISVETAGSGPGGNVSIDARSLTLSGLGTRVSADTAASTAGGPAGTIRISTRDLAVTDGAIVLAGTFGSGAGGRTIIDASRVTLRGLPTDTLDEFSTAIAVGSLGGSGSGGMLTLRADSVSISSGSAIAVGTSGSGHGGDAEITARTVRLDRGGIVAGSQSDDPSIIATGNAGSVSVHATKSISLRNGANIGAKADDAIGGNVTLQSPRITLRDSMISGQAGPVGGNINISAHTLLYLFRSQINAVGQQSLGSINIDPIFTVLDQSTIMTTADITGGNINLRTDRFFKSLDSVITAARNATVTLTIYTPDTNITGSLVPVNASLIDSSASFIEECSRRLQVDLSSFLITGRGGQPPEPGGLNPAFDLRGNPTTAPVR